MASRAFHLVVWGCTGFTGKQACEYLAETYGLPSDQFKYAIAGRDESRMKGVEEMMLKKAKDAKPGSSIPKILADVADEASIVSMVKKTKCVLALAGPYAKCGEPVVKACAENGTHYVDVTGEMGWVCEMRTKYHQKAVSSGSKIIPAVGGLDFMPNEALMIFVNQECLNRELHLNRVYQYIQWTGKGVSGGTLRSIFGMFKCLSLKQTFRSVLTPYSLCEKLPSDAVVAATKPPCGFHYQKDLQCWAGRSFVGQGMSSYLRWSNEVSNYGWGKDVVIQVYDCSSWLFLSVLKLFSLLFLPAIVWILSRFPFLERFCPASGNATFSSTASDSEHYVKVLADASVTEKGKNQQLKLKCEYYSPYECYHMTGLGSIETAMASVFDQTPSMCGVVSASGAIGSALVSRLQKRRITFKTELTD